MLGPVLDAALQNYQNPVSQGQPQQGILGGANAPSVNDAALNPTQAPPPIASNAGVIGGSAPAVTPSAGSSPTASATISGLAPSTFTMLQKYVTPPSAQDPESVFDSLLKNEQFQDTDQETLAEKNKITALMSAAKFNNGPNDPRLIQAWNDALPVLQGTIADMQKPLGKGASNDDKEEWAENQATATDLQNLVNDHLQHYPNGNVPIPAATPQSATQNSPQGFMGGPGAGAAPSAHASLSLLNVDPPQGGQGVLSTNPANTATNPLPDTTPGQPSGPTTVSIPQQVAALQVPVPPRIEDDPEYSLYQQKQADYQAKQQAVRDANSAVASLKIPDAPAPKDYTSADAAKIGLSLLPALFMRGQGAGSYLLGALKGYKQEHDSNLDTDEMREYQQKVNQGNAAVQNAQMAASQSGNEMNDVLGRIQNRSANAYSVSQQQYNNQVLSKQLQQQALDSGNKLLAGLLPMWGSPKATAGTIQGSIAAYNEYQSQTGGRQIDPGDPIVQPFLKAAIANDLQGHEMALQKLNLSGTKQDQTNYNNFAKAQQAAINAYVTQHGGVSAGPQEDELQEVLHNLAHTYSVDPSLVVPLSAFTSVADMKAKAQADLAEAGAGLKNMQTQYYPANMQRMADQTYGNLKLHQDQLQDAMSRGDQQAEQKSWQAILTQSQNAVRLATAAGLKYNDDNDPQKTYRTALSQQVADAQRQISAATGALKQIGNTQSSATGDFGRGSGGAFGPMNPSGLLGGQQLPDASNFQQDTQGQYPGFGITGTIPPPVHGVIGGGHVSKTHKPKHVPINIVKGV